MAEIEIKFEIDEEDQVQGLMTQEEFKEWLGKRHQHIYWYNAVYFMLIAEFNITILLKWGFYIILLKGE